MKNNTFSQVPAWFSWAAMLLAAMVALKWLLPWLLKASGLSGLFLDVKGATVGNAIEEKVKKDPVKYQQTTGNTVTVTQIGLDAAKLSHELGYDVPFYFPSGWFINNSKVLEILKPYTKDTFALLRIQYNAQKFENGSDRDLVADLKKELYPEYVSKIQYLWL